MDAPRRPVLTAPVRIARSIAGRGLYESVLPIDGARVQVEEVADGYDQRCLACCTSSSRAACRHRASRQQPANGRGPWCARRPPHTLPSTALVFLCVIYIYIRSGPPRTLLAPHTRAKLAGCTYMILRRRMLFNSLSLTFCKLRGCPTSASGASRGCRLGTIPLVQIQYEYPVGSPRSPDRTLTRRGVGDRTRSTVSHATCRGDPGRLARKT